LRNRRQGAAAEQDDESSDEQQEQLEQWANDNNDPDMAAEDVGPAGRRPGRRDNARLTKAQARKQQREEMAQ